MIFACASLFGGFVGRFVIGGLVGVTIFLVALFFKLCRRWMGKRIGPVVAIVVDATAIAFVFPRLEFAREKVRRTTSICQLQQIGLALAQYSIDHKGRLPATLDVLAPTLIREKTFIDAVTGQRFVYVGAGMEWGGDTFAVVAYSPPTTAGASVLFDDGHLRWISSEQLQDALHARKK